MDLNMVNNWFNQEHVLLWYWIEYCILCIPIVFILMICLPFKKRFKPFWTAAYLYLLAITIPFVGVFISIVIIVMIVYFPPIISRKIPISTASYPDYQRPPQKERTPYGEGVGFKMVTENIVPKSSRKEMLVMMNQVEGPVINKINKLVLEDTEDEIRLYAQSLMEKQEEKLLHLTTKFNKALLNAKDPKDEAWYKKVIAIILWEQIYKGLTTHINLDIALDKIRNLALEAFELLPEDSELPLILAKIALKHKNYEEAKMWLRKAELNEAPDYKIISYIAEIAFYEKNYPAIRTLLANNRIIGLQPITSFWMIND
jgi:hypothetical protein